MREAFFDTDSQPFINWSSCPLFDTDPSGSHFGPLGGGQATSNRTFDTVDRPLQVGRTCVTTLTGSGAFGRRWIPGAEIFPGTGACPVRPGDTVAIWYWIKLSAATLIRSLVEFSDAAGQYIGGNSVAIGGGNELTPPAGQWVRLEHRFLVNHASAVYLRSFGFQSLVSRDAGFEFRLGPSGAIVNRPVPPAQVDGSTPGWKYLGAAGLSRSVGYPYTLESIAGKPFYFAENVVSASAAVTEIPAGLFTVASSQRTTDPSLSPGMWTADAHPTSGLAVDRSRRIIAQTVNYRSDTARSDDPSLLVSRSYPTTDPTVLRTFVGRATATAMHWVIDGTVQSVEAPGSPTRPLNSTLYLRVGARDGSAYSVIQTKGIALWTKSLNDETAKRVNAWFARRYGTPIPAGY